MKKLTILIILAVIAFELDAQAVITYPDGATNPPDFINLSYQAASDAADSETEWIATRNIKKINSQYIANLVAEIRNEKTSSDNKVLAIYLLGVLKPDGTNSIETLINDIDFEATRYDQMLKTRTGIQRWGKYPAKEALIKIGKPAIDLILTHLPKETNELRRQLMCDVIRQVLKRQ